MSMTSLPGLPLPETSPRTLAAGIARELGLETWRVENTVAMLDEGNTIPFIARYRKERTGELDEEALRNIQERLEYSRALAARKEEVLRLISEQGKLTGELAQAIAAAGKLQQIEDLYRPYRQKRRTRATIARERGLEPLADLIWAQEAEQQRDGGGRPLETAAAVIERLAARFVSPEKDVPDVSAAVDGAKDILAERLSDDAAIRTKLRDFTRRAADVTCGASDQVKADSAGAAVYQMYLDYREPLRTMPPHRVLAINRGEREGFLRVALEVPDPETPIMLIRSVAIKNERSVFAATIIETCGDAYKRLLAPSLERELRAEATERAEEQAIGVFAKNLRPLLLQPPLRGHVVVGIDPGFRTGCKVAVVNPSGDVLDTATIYPHAPQNRRDEAKVVLAGLISSRGADVVAIGNGTASRETEQLVAELIDELASDSGQRVQPAPPSVPAQPTFPAQPVRYAIVSEAGASVYSASRLAREELPDLDVTMRGAVSIARRLQDPLAELVKIDPKSIGVGQYQHDVNQTRLAEALRAVVESCVNWVGVDLNSASPALLEYVAGLSASVARNIVNYRREHGPFRSRKELLKVPRLGPRAFVQCAGFLRVPESGDPLDKTAVHPESYELARRIIPLLQDNSVDQGGAELGDGLGTALEAGIGAGPGGSRLTWLAEELASSLGAGVPTVRDIIDALQKPGRDPREELPGPMLRTDVLTIEDLRPGMELQGTVRNVVDFGAFVDIGVKEDGLVHISQLADRYVKHPTQVVSVGDVVKVHVLDVDLARKRIALSMKIQ